MHFVSSGRFAIELFQQAFERALSELGDAHAYRRQAEMTGKDKITVPVEKKPSLEQQVAKNEPTPVEQLNIPDTPIGTLPESKTRPSQKVLEQVMEELR